MANTFFLEIVNPDRKFFADDVEMLVLQTPEGEVGIMRDHMPMVIAVSIGPVRMLKDGKWQEAFLSEGFLEIMQNKAVILTDSAEWPDEIDANRARAAEERAREHLQGHLSHMEYIRTQAALHRAVSRLKVSRHNNTKDKNNGLNHKS